MQLRGWYKGKEFVASLHRDGQIQFAGKKFPSPSTAAAKASGVLQTVGSFGTSETKEGMDSTRSFEAVKQPGGSSPPSHKLSERFV